MPGTASFQPRADAADAMLQACGQAQVLRFYDDLDDRGKEKLLGEIEAVDWPEVARLVDTHVRTRAAGALPAQLEPAPYYPCVPTVSLKQTYSSARELGKELASEGKVAAFTVAGGQGTRLGWDAPKGSFAATPIRKLPLFGCFAHYLQKSGQKFGCAIPWYIMTSPANDSQTRAIFDAHDYFGLDRANVMFFPQAMMPALDAQTGLALLAQRDGLALSPNGHGGSLKALDGSGALADMKKRGITQISYTQVDNPSVQVIDPLFIGLHALEGAQMSSKMVPKAYPTEKLGNFCRVDGKVTVIEYCDLPDALAQQRHSSGQLRFCAGSIAIHMIQVDFVASLNRAGGGFALPFHRAQKKVPYLDLPSGQLVEPEAPNAVKLETFVFDALPLCEVSVILETDRVEEFAPIKNADVPGAVDTAATSRQLQIDRAGRWLQQKGVTVPMDDDGHVDAVIEISALTAIEPSDLDGIELPERIAAGAQLLL